MSEESPNLPASREPTFEPPRPSMPVDLSDLQAEMDGERQAADEESVHDDDPGEEPQPQRKSRVQRYREQINRQREEIARLEASLNALTDAEVAEALDPAGDDGAGDMVEEFPGEADLDEGYAADAGLRAALQNGHQHNGHGNGHQAPQPLSYHDMQRMSVAELEALADQELARDAEEKRQAQILHQREQKLLDRERRDRINEWVGRGHDALSKRQNQLAYDAAMRKADELDLWVDPKIAGVIGEHAQVGALVEHFANHPRELAEVNKLAVSNPAKAGAMLEGLAMRITRRSEPKLHTTAPPPPRILRGGASPPSPERELDAYIARKYPNRR